MDRLDQAGISYDVCPGVSAFCERQRPLNLEYTLPGVSQSVIITRMAGRTPVPERESIESFAAHGASMAIFLSTGMLEELSSRLMAGGYAEDTPAAIVYKATWPDEKTCVCTVGTLAETAREAGNYQDSPHPGGPGGGTPALQPVGAVPPSLYHGLPGSKTMSVWIVAFTPPGANLAAYLGRTLPGARAFSMAKYAAQAGTEPVERLADWCRRAWEEAEGLVFVGAAGIAVRSIAPRLQSKTTDPAVVAVDEGGNLPFPGLRPHGRS